jgi:glycerophosphoryl diester phosphodiesterase
MKKIPTFVTPSQALTTTAFVLALTAMLLPGLLVPTFAVNSDTPPHSSQVNAEKRPLIIAHRGGAKEFTENTIEGFNRAMRLGADGNETDLRLTRDGVVVIYHDERFGRVEGLNNGRSGRLLSDMTYSELTAHTLTPVGEDSGGKRVPTLRQLLREVNSGLLNIEIKRGDRYDELVDKTIEELRGSPALSRVVLEPPDLPTAEKIRATLGANLRLHINPAYDTSVPFDEALKKVLAFKPHSISVSYRRLSWEIVDKAHQAGVEVWVWTVDQPNVGKAMALLGVDAIKTDVPTLMLREIPRTN